MHEYAGKSIHSGIDPHTCCELRTAVAISGVAKTREVSELTAVMPARQGAALRRGVWQTRKPHAKTVIRVALDVARMEFIDAASIQPEIDATARGSGAAKT